jgi:hypothetical protein
VNVIVIPTTMRTLQFPYRLTDAYDGQQDIREAESNDEITDITEDIQYDWYNFYPDSAF